MHINLGQTCIIFILCTRSMVVSIGSFLLDDARVNFSVSFLVSFGL